MSSSAGTLWAEMRAEASERSAREPVLASFYHANILNHGSLEAALACVLAVRLETGMLPAMLLRDVVDEALRDDPLITVAVREDLLAHGAEIALDAEGLQALGRVFRDQLVDPFLDVVEFQDEQLAVAQDVQRRDVRQHAMAARLGEQRAVVAAREIAVASAQVDDAQRLLQRLLGQRQVVGESHDMLTGEEGTPIRKVIDDNLQHGGVEGYREIAGDGSRAARWKQRRRRKFPVLPARRHAARLPGNDCREGVSA